tara:strand:- start:266 stop:652 length:387 start_codon:yes stop_codon:yes gene_type:complete
MSPVQRTLALLKKQNIPCGIVERFVKNGAFGFRKDLFGIIDIIALGSHGVKGIQVCGTDYAPHWKKITEEKWKESEDWLNCPGTSLEIWSWRKVKKVRGGKAMVWKLRLTEVSTFDIQPTNKGEALVS